MSVINSIYPLRPANLTAGRVASQRGCSKQLERLSRSELSAIAKRVQEQRKPLKEALGIHSRSQHKDLMYWVNRRGTNWHEQPEILNRYIQTGEMLRKIHAELQQLRLDRKTGEAA